MDYSDEAVKSITVKFSEIGVYSFDSIEVVCQPMTDYPNQITALKENILNKADISPNLVKGVVSLEKPAVLCLSIPYSVGWKAYVDGEPSKLYKANVKNMALVLDGGEHTVELVYRTPFILLGFGISAVGILMLGAMVVYRRKKKKYYL